MDGVLTNAASLGSGRVFDFLLMSKPKCVEVKNTVSWKFRHGTQRASALHVAAYYGNGGIVAKVLAMNVSPADGAVPVSPKSKSPFWLASEQGHTHVVRLILDASQNRQAPRSHKVYSAQLNPVADAALHGHHEVVTLLAQRGKEARLSLQHFARALYVAAAKGHTEVVAALLSSGLDFDVNYSNVRKMTAFHVAIQNAHVDIAKCLLQDSRVDVNLVDAAGRSPLHLALRCAEVEVAIILLRDDRVDVCAVCKRGKSALGYAVFSGKADLVSALLEDRRFDAISAASEELLHIAAEHGFVHVARVLLRDKRFSVNARAEKTLETPLMCAARELHARFVELLLLEEDIHVGVVDRNGSNALHHAISSWDHESQSLRRYIKREQHEERVLQVVFRLLQSGAKSIDVNCVSRTNRSSPLHLAVDARLPRVVDYLVGLQGIDINAVCADGETALYKAVAAKFDNGVAAASEADRPISASVKIVESLLRHPKIDVNASTPVYASVLHRAVKEGSPEIVSVLLRDERVRVDITDENGMSAAHLAARGGRLNVIREFIECERVNLNAVDLSGTTVREALLRAARMTSMSARHDGYNYEQDSFSDHYERDVYSVHNIFDSDEDYYY